MLVIKKSSDMKTNKRTITLMLLLIIGLSGVSAQSKKKQKEQREQAVKEQIIKLV